MAKHIGKNRERVSSKKSVSSNSLALRSRQPRFRASRCLPAKVAVRNDHPPSEAGEEGFRQPMFQKIRQLRPDPRYEQICERQTDRHETQNIAKRDDAPGRVLAVDRIMSRRSR